MHMLRHVLGGCVCVLTFMLTGRKCTCFVTSWVGGWVGLLAFMLTCRTCFVTSWVCVCVFFNVHVTLPHMHMLRHVWVSPSGRSLVALWRSAWPRERRKTSREFFNIHFPCKLQEIIKHAQEIPGPIVSLWRKRHFLKTLTTAGAVFPTGSLSRSARGPSRVSNRDKPIPPIP